MAFTFINTITEKAKKQKMTIAIPEVTNAYMVKAAVKATEDGIADIILVGDPSEVEKTAKECGVDASGIRVVDVNDEEIKEKLLEKYDASPYKSMPKNFVGKRLDNPLYLATLLHGSRRSRWYFGRS